jgi:thiosulfate dehydrogenase (quinone) large subunit
MTKPPTRKKPRAQLIPPETLQTLDATSWHRVLADRSKLSVPAWVALPLRLFLGVTFMYAGLQKLTDPHYFDPSAQDFIGNQIRGFAAGSPIGGLLLHLVVPHATLFGGLIAWGELAIGLGVLVGVMVRPAAMFGALLSLIFFLSASWRVHPYFYGSDIVFLFSWTVIVLAGPEAGGWPTFDRWLASRLLERVPRERQALVTLILKVALGEQETGKAAGLTAQTAGAPGGRSAERAERPAPARSRRIAVYGRRQTRRDFFNGVVSGVVGTLGFVLLASLLRGGNDSSSTGGDLTNPPASGGSVATSAAGVTTIAEISQVSPNSAVGFTVPRNGDPGVLVHLVGGRFVAFDALCTHAGCTVQYDPSSHLLLCPCHGAAFDPSRGASVVAGPAPTPLTAVPVRVDQASGAITVSS